MLIILIFILIYRQYIESRKRHKFNDFSIPRMNKMSKKQKKSLYTPDDVMTDEFYEQFKVNSVK